MTYRNVTDAPRPLSREDRLARWEAQATHALPSVGRGLLATTWAVFVWGSYFSGEFAFVLSICAAIGVFVVWATNRDGDDRLTKYPILCTAAILGALVLLPWAVCALGAL